MRVCLLYMFTYTTICLYLCVCVGVCSWVFANCARVSYRYVCMFVCVCVLECTHILGDIHECACMCVCMHVYVCYRCKYVRMYVTDPATLTSAICRLAELMCAHVSTVEWRSRQYKIAQPVSTCLTALLRVIPKTGLCMSLFVYVCVSMYVCACVCVCMCVCACVCVCVCACVCVF